MNIGLDFDGVIADCGELKSYGIQKLFGIVVAPEDCKKEIVLTKGLLTADQYRTMQRMVYDTKEYGLRMKAVTGAIEGIQQLLHAGHMVHVVTSRNEAGLDIAMKWLHVHGITLPCHGVGYGKSKADACASCDVFVDDDIDKLEDLIHVVPRLFLFSWAYNEHVSHEHEQSAIYTRIQSWPALISIISTLK